MKNLSKNTPRTLLPALLALLVVAGAAVAQPAPIPATPSPGFGRYVLVLWEPGTPIPTNPGQHFGPIAEPNVSSLGGILLRATDNRLLIDLPLTAAAEMRTHPSVKYMQRLWMGEPLEELDEESTATTRRPGIASEDDPSEWGPRSYAYDGSGNIRQFGDDSYTYDTANRLIQAELGARTEKYKYDAFGNLVEVAIDGTSPVAIPVDPGSNRLMGRRYDQAGNVLEGRGKAGTYQYDSLNMLVQYGDYTKIYDANDEQIASIYSGQNGPEHRYTIRDVDGRLLREFYSPQSWICLWKQDYVYGETQLVGGESVQIQFQTSQGTQTYGGIRHYHLDHLGSVRMVTDANGRSTSENDYYPFGIEATPRNQDYALAVDEEIDSARFAGHHRDFAGLINTENRDYLDYMHARYYDPGLGRFLSVDPGGDVDLYQPQSWNRYTYVRNNPTNNIDPTGRCTNSVVCLNWGMDEEVEVTAPDPGTLGPWEQAVINQVVAQDEMVQSAKDSKRFIYTPTQQALTETFPQMAVAFPVALGAVQGGLTSTAVNTVPRDLARVIPGELTPATLGRQGASDVFVTAYDDVAGMSANQLGPRLGIPQSEVYTVIKFPTPMSGVASPIARSMPGFVGRGFTTGGAREFVIPNGPIPWGGIIRTIRTVGLP